MHRFCLNCGFRITTAHADGKFAPLQAMTQKQHQMDRQSIWQAAARSMSLKSNKESGQSRKGAGPQDTALAFPSTGSQSF
jgi:hypothetical protein